MHNTPLYLLLLFPADLIQKRRRKKNYSCFLAGFSNATFPNYSDVYAKRQLMSKRNWFDLSVFLLRPHKKIELLNKKQKKIYSMNIAFGKPNACRFISKYVICEQVP